MRKKDIKETLQKHLDDLLYDRCFYRKELLLYFPLMDNSSVETLEVIKDLSIKQHSQFS